MLWRNKTSDLHLIVDSTGLKLRGAGDGCLKARTAKRRAWRKLTLALRRQRGDVAFDLTNKDVDDASHVETLLEPIDEAPASFMADGAYDRAPFSRRSAGTEAPDSSFLLAGGRNLDQLLQHHRPNAIGISVGSKSTADELAEGLRLQQAFQGKRRP